MANDNGSGSSPTTSSWELTAAPFQSHAQRALLLAGWEPFAGMPMPAATADGRQLDAVPTVLYRRRVSPLAVAQRDVADLVRRGGSAA